MIGAAHGCLELLAVPDAAGDLHVDDWRGGAERTGASEVHDERRAVVCGHREVLLDRGESLAAGCHGNEIPGEIDQRRLAFLHMVDREVGLAVSDGVKLRSLRALGRMGLASRPQ